MPTQVAWEAFLDFKLPFVVEASAALKTLLEDKHLYQRVAFSPDNQVARNFHAKFKGVSIYEAEFVSDFVTSKFLLSTSYLYSEPGHRLVLCLIVTNVKLFCSNCGTREAFRPVWFSDITDSLKTVAGKNDGFKSSFDIAFNETFQLFILVFQCQRCEGLPETFLVKRDEFALVLEGRSPIEHIELPNFIPKDEKHWFRDAVIAFQSGKTLAGLFYLRTFIEQFARRKTNILADKKTGDEILTAYAETIPGHLRDTMPSLREQYGNLSEALHQAKEDEKLFTSTQEKIEEHFDIRRVHKLDAKDS